MLEDMSDEETPRHLDSLGTWQDTVLPTLLDLLVDSSSSSLKDPFSRCRNEDSSSVPALQSRKGNKKPNRKPRGNRDGMESKEAHAFSELLRRGKMNLLIDLGSKLPPQWFKELVKDSQWDVAHSTNHCNETSKNTLTFELVTRNCYLETENQFLRRYMAVPNKMPALASVIIDEFGRYVEVQTKTTELKKMREKRDNRSSNTNELATETQGRSNGKSMEEKKKKKQTGSRSGTGQKRKSTKL